MAGTFGKVRLWTASTAAVTGINAIRELALTPPRRLPSALNVLIIISCCRLINKKYYLAFLITERRESLRMNGVSTARQRFRTSKELLAGK